MQKDNLFRTGIIIIAIILFICGLLATFTKLPMDIFAITISIWVFGILLFQFCNRNYLFLIGFIGLGILNLMVNQFFHVFATSVVYFSCVLILLSTLRKNKD